jgi:hypothetical protein
MSSSQYFKTAVLDGELEGGVSLRWLEVFEGALISVSLWD